jgi:hypothetical protein
MSLCTKNQFFAFKKFPKTKTPDESSSEVTSGVGTWIPRLYFSSEWFSSVENISHLNDLVQSRKIRDKKI